MKQIQLALVLVPMFVGTGCASYLSDVSNTSPWSKSHVVDQRFPGGDVVHIERTDSKLPSGVGVSGVVVGGGVYAQPIITNEYIAPNGSVAMEQISGGTTHVIGVPIVQPPPTPSAQTGDGQRAVVILAKGHLQQQEEIDEINKRLDGIAPKTVSSNK